MREKRIEDILEGFNPHGPEVTPISAGAPVTIWLPAQEKAKYDRLQKMTKGTGRRFSDIARETLVAIIRAAETKAS